MKKKEKIKKNIRKENGITITAMVIAIILLIILAAISITSVMDGDRTIFETAYDAKTSMEVATYQEELDIIDVQCASEGINTGFSAAEYIESFITALSEDSTFDESTVRKVTNSTVEITTEEGYVFVVSQDDGVEYAGASDYEASYSITEDDVTFTYTPYGDYTKTGWANDYVEVEITMEFDLVEGTSFQYSYDKETWVDYTEALEVQSNTKIYVMYETYGDDYVIGEVTTIDKVAPADFGNVALVGETTTKTATITGSTYDVAETDEYNSATSGINHYEFAYSESLIDVTDKDSVSSLKWYDIDDSATYDADSDDIIFTFDGLTQTTFYYLYIKAQDEAGNYSIGYVTATTTEVPSGIDYLTINLSDNYSAVGEDGDTSSMSWTSEDITFTITVSDETVQELIDDGTYKIEYTTNGSTWGDYANNIGDGYVTISENTTIGARISDGTNSGEENIIEIACIDKEAPTDPTITVDETKITNYSITVSVESEDNEDGSGIDYYFFTIQNYYLDSDGNEVYEDVDGYESGYMTESSTVTFTGLENGYSYVINVAVYDKSDPANVSQTDSSNGQVKVSTGTSIPTLTYEYQTYGWGLGDYVDYSIDLDGDGDTTDDWRIYYIEYNDDYESYKDSDPDSSVITSDEVKYIERVFIISDQYIERESEYISLEELQVNRYGIYTSDSDGNYTLDSDGNYTIKLTGTNATYGFNWYTGSGTLGSSDWTTEGVSLALDTDTYETDDDRRNIIYI